MYEVKQANIHFYSLTYKEMTIKHSSVQKRQW